MSLPYTKIFRFLDRCSSPVAPHGLFVASSTIFEFVFPLSTPLAHFPCRILVSYYLSAAIKYPVPGLVKSMLLRLSFPTSFPYPCQTVRRRTAPDESLIVLSVLRFSLSPLRSHSPGKSVPTSLTEGWTDTHRHPLSANDPLINWRHILEHKRPHESVAFWFLGSNSEQRTVIGCHRAASNSLTIFHPSELN
jgi:hypothetical protein